MPKIPLVGPSGKGRVTDQNYRRSVNVYVESDDAGGKEKVYGIGRHGTLNFATAGAVVRGRPLVFGTLAYYVAGDKLYSLTSAGVSTAVGTLTSNSGNTVGMTKNRTQILIVDGTDEMFVYQVLAQGGVAAGTFTTVGSFSTELLISGIVQKGGVGTTFVATTTTDHGASASDIALISGTTSFNGEVTITAVPLTTTFEFVHANDTDADETGLADAVAQIRTDNLTIQPTTCTHIDGYGVVNNTRTSPGDSVHPGQFYPTALDDFTTIDVTMRAEAQRNPDDLIAVYAIGGDLQLYGTESLEHYYNSGSAEVPFVPTRAAATQWGIVAKDSLVELGDGMAWVGRRANGSATVLVMEGYLPAEIASRAVLYRLAQATETQRAAATAFSFRDEGHDFYVLTFASETWVYDHAESKKLGTPMWTEWTSYNGTAYTKFIGKWYVNAWGKHLVTDHTNARFLQLSLDTYTDTEAGTSRAIQRVLVTGYVDAEDKPLYHSRVHVDIAHTGTGTLLLESSDDGGDNWVSHGTFAVTSIDSRAEWWQHGLARTDRQYRITTTDAIAFAVLGMYLDATPGEN